MLQTLFHVTGIISMFIAGACFYTGIKLKDWFSLLGFTLLGILMIVLGIWCLMV